MQKAQSSSFHFCQSCITNSCNSWECNIWELHNDDGGRAGSGISICLHEPGSCLRGPRGAALDVFLQSFPGHQGSDPNPHYGRLPSEAADNAGDGEMWQNHFPFGGQFGVLHPAAGVRYSVGHPVQPRRGRLLHGYPVQKYRIRTNCGDARLQIFFSC